MRPNTDEALALDPHKRVPIARVRELCGGVSEMTVHRWLREPSMDFPRPIYIGQRRYWREVSVVAWLDAQPEAGIPDCEVDEANNGEAA